MSDETIRALIRAPSVWIEEAEPPSSACAGPDRKAANPARSAILRKPGNDTTAVLPDKSLAALPPFAADIDFIRRREGVKRRLRLNVSGTAFIPCGRPRRRRRR